jgi:thiol-disulfide isomerase/thioredoxin
MKKNILTLFMVIITLFSNSTIYAQDLTGTKAPNFEFTDINGNIISTENTVNKVVVLNFWFVGCAPCLKEIPELNEIYDTYKDASDVVFASITYDDLKKVKKNLNKYNFKYPIITNAKETCDLFQINGYPTNIVIDKKGEIFFTFTGGFSGIGKVVSKSIQRALEIDD